MQNFYYLCKIALAADRCGVSGLCAHRLLPVLHRCAVEPHEGKLRLFRPERRLGKLRAPAETRYQKKKSFGSFLRRCKSSFLHMYTASHVTTAVYTQVYSVQDENDEDYYLEMVDNFHHHEQILPPTVLEPVSND